jgi:hypothetical protein
MSTPLTWHAPMRVASGEAPLACRRTASVSSGSCGAPCSSDAAMVTSVRDS